MKWIKYSHRQKVSLLIMAFLIFGITVFRFIEQWKFMNNGPLNDPIEIASYSEDIFGKENPSYIRSGTDFKKSKDAFSDNYHSEMEAFHFDPNSLSKDSLLMLGFSKFATNNLMKYRENGGKFKNKESLLKVYGVDSQLYEQLEAYIEIKEKHSQSENRKKVSAPKIDTKSKAKARVQVDVNRASEADFKKLSGIGEKLSQRLVKYREALGGFHSFEQLNEIYGLPEETYEAILPQLLMESHSLQKIPINSVSFKTLLKHPYADYELTKKLINYRNSHGSFKSEDDFNSIYLIDSEKLSRLLPYLSFEIMEEATSPDSSAIDMEKGNK